MPSSSALFRRIEHRRLSVRHHYRGSRTDAAGLTGTTWPVTSQSNRWRIAASFCLTLGAACSRAGLDPGGDVHRLDASDRPHTGARAPGQKFIRGASIGAARVRVADVGREKLEEAPAGARAGGGGQGRKNGTR
jgi:hypothetical protein